MIRTRVIPCLLLKNEGLVKTVKFRNQTYVGDPINTVRIFNDKEVDELVFLDISATREKRRLNFRLMEHVASECFMPLGYGGGVSSVEDMKALFSIGMEKVIINSCAVSDQKLIEKAADQFGSQSVVVSIDVKKDWLGRYRVFIDGGRTNTGLDPVKHAVNITARGAGELFLTSIDRDGTFNGYDLELIRNVTSQVDVPVVACGGAKTVADLGKAVNEGGASAAAAGSMFVFQGPHRAVLISYPSPDDLQNLFNL